MNYSMTLSDVACRRSYFSAPGLYTNPFYSIEHRLKFLICQEYCISERQLISKDRHTEYILPRHLYRYLLSLIKGEPRLNVRANRKYTLDEVANLTGCDKHETILHSIKTTKNLLSTDRCFKKKYENIISKLDKTLFDL